MSTVLFLGAGASQALDFPPTKEFMQEADKRIHGEVYDQIVHYCHKKYGDTIDIEQVLWDLMDFENWFKKLSDGDTYKKWLMLDSKTVSNGDLLRDKGARVNKTITDIYTLVYDIYWKDVEGASEIYLPLVDLIEEYSVGEEKLIDIFTTNYDLCVENAFWGSQKRKGHLTDGFAYNGITVK